MTLTSDFILNSKLGYTEETIIDFIINDPYSGVTLVDYLGRIIFGNDTFFKDFELDKKNVLGHYIKDLFPSGKIMEVAKSGIPQKGYVFTVNEKDFVASSYPIISDRKIIGVIARSVFLNIEDAKEFAKRMSSYEGELKHLRDIVQQDSSTKYDFTNIIGESEVFIKVKRLAEVIANNDNTVLITGESGTGKDLFAKTIHNSSIRKNGPFIRLNCATIPQQLIESELFGYDKGAFTGALNNGKKGKFELANKGTIFLDEIGELPLAMQAKLLTVLQEKEIEPLGSQATLPRKIDVRIIAATNQNLQKMIEEGLFRQDLYYRLNVITLALPPLRNRNDDIIPLIHWILHKRNSELGSKFTIETDAQKLLLEYNWPGNVRELENFIEKGIWLATLESSSSIKASHIRELLGKTVIHSKSLLISNDTELPTLKNYIELCEKKLIEKTLKTTNGDKKTAADMLNMHISGLYKKINKYDLDNL